MALSLYSEKPIWMNKVCMYACKKTGDSTPPVEKML